MSLVYIISAIIVLVSIMLVIKGFKPKWYHFFFFPISFVFLMATYDILKTWWERVIFIDPWASFIFTLSIVIAAFILWTQTLKEE